MKLNEPDKFHKRGLKGLPSKMAINLERSKYGIAQADIICLHNYLGLVIANGLRLLVEYEHGWPGTEEFPTIEIWEAKLIEIAEKLEQSSTTDEQVNIMFGEIDWDLDEPVGLEEDDWLEKSTSGPAFKEYSRRSDEIHKLALENSKEALEWLSKYWFALWD